MGKNKNFYLLCMIVVLSFFLQNASAAFLPISSYADGHWQGSRSFNQNMEGGKILSGQVDFAVYDTWGGNEFALNGYEALGDGRYTYVYQIFSDDSATDIITYFSVFAKSGNSMAIDEEDMGTTEDTPDSGENPSGKYLTTDKKEAVWLFSDGGLEGGEHSWFLVFSSNYAPVAGDFEVKSETTPVPIPETPEPATIILLGIGTTWTFLGRRRSKW